MAYCIIRIGYCKQLDLLFRRSTVFSAVTHLVGETGFLDREIEAASGFSAHSPYTSLLVSDTSLLTSDDDTTASVDGGATSSGDDGATTVERVSSFLNLCNKYKNNPATIITTAVYPISYKETMPVPNETFQAFKKLSMGAITRAAIDKR
jgi:hypothetical protein